MVITQRSYTIGEHLAEHCLRVRMVTLHRNGPGELVTRAQDDRVIGAEQMGRVDSGAGQALTCRDSSAQDMSGRGHRGDRDQIAEVLAVHVARCRVEKGVQVRSEHQVIGPVRGPVVVQVSRAVAMISIAAHRTSAASSSPSFASARCARLVAATTGCTTTARRSALVPPNGRISIRLSARSPLFTSFTAGVARNHDQCSREVTGLPTG